MRELAGEATLFTRTMLGSLRSSTYIAIHKVFEEKSRHNLTTLIESARANLDMFGREGFRDRRIAQESRLTLDQIDAYASGIHIPTAADFAELEPAITKWTDLYKLKIRDARNLWYGHRVFSTIHEANDELAETSLDDIEGMLAFLNNLNSELHQLLQNGKKIDVALLVDPPREIRPNSVQYRTSLSVERFFAADKPSPSRTKAGGNP